MPPNRVSTHQRAKRDVIKGWTPGATRRLTKWLYSVENEKLSGYGHALTLTMRDTPPDRAALDRTFRALMARYDRLGVVRLQWVMELQRRGTPHFHMAVYTAEPLPRGGWELVEHWLAVAEPWGASWGAQKVEALKRENGWFRYMSKHASRSVGHYQRVGMPPGWTVTGRLWGKRGDWPTVDAPMNFDMSREAWFRYRRMLKAYRLNDARRERDAQRRRDRVLKAQRMLSHPDRRVSEVRGVSEWVPQHVQIGFLGLLADQGYEITQVLETEPTQSPLVRRLQRSFHEGLTEGP